MNGDDSHLDSLPPEMRKSLLDMRRPQAKPVGHRGLIVMTAIALVAGLGLMAIFG